MFPLFRAVIVWTVLLAVVVLPRMDQPVHSTTPVAVTQIKSYDRQSVVSQARAQRTKAAQDAQVQAWAAELNKGLATYQAQLKVLAAAKAEAARYAALSNHAPPPPYIAKIINDAFSPLGPRAVQWAINVAYCESRYHPNSVNTDSGATGLFQFMAGTWSGTPWASKSRFDPVANAQAAAWLYKTYGPQRWSCIG
ncbi:MAG TPA: transglycosylase SLT domain-containing protein [Candidatus Saccharimonadia bacterium]|nr:transglycosylase SLT domain-containing protein [Candidatus Saccharimonadia bacterium]